MGKSIKFYAERPERILGMTGELTLEEIAVETILRALFFANDGRIPDNDYFVAGNLRVDLRVWRRVKGSLAAKAGLVVRDKFLEPAGAAEELSRIRDMLAAKRYAGATSGSARRHKSCGNIGQSNDLPRTDARTFARQTLEEEEELSFESSSSYQKVGSKNESGTQARDVEGQEEDAGKAELATATDDSLLAKKIARFRSNISAPMWDRWLGGAEFQAGPPLLILVPAATLSVVVTHLAARARSAFGDDVKFVPLPATGAHQEKP